MAQSVLVRCPDCGRAHSYTPPVYPCVCGTPVTLPLLPGGEPERVRHRTWRGSWVEAGCPSCGAEEQWPQPELGCGCGTLLRLPVELPQGRAASAAGPGGDGDADPPAAGPARGPAPKDAGEAAPLPAPGAGGEPGGGPSVPAAPFAPPRPAVPRPAFRPVTIRTAHDARAAAAQYLRWLGFGDVRAAGKRTASGVDLRGAGVVAHVDPSTAPTAGRAVETLWLNGLNESALAVCFALAGYARDARTGADALGVPLFVLDLAGVPQPVNDAADALLRGTL